MDIVGLSTVRAIPEHICGDWLSNSLKSSGKGQLKGGEGGQVGRIGKVLSIQ